jgi:ketosteroid isomerase-like protein
MGSSTHGGIDIDTATGHEGYDVVGYEHLAVMEALLNGYRTGDRSAPGRAMDPAVEVVQPASTPFGGLHQGVDGVQTMLERMERHWTRHWNWVHRHPCQEFVVNHEEVVWSAVATGRKVTLQTVSLYRFRHRRIARIDVFTQDTALLLETLRPLP